MNVHSESLLVQDVVDDEYSTNFFKFTAKDLHDGIMNSIVPEAIAESTERLKRCMLQNCKGYDNEIEEACSTLLKESLAAVPGISMPLKDLTDMHFKIPKNVLLEQDSIQSVQYSEEDIKKMDMEIVALEDRITKASFMEARLEEELELIAKFKETVTDANIGDLVPELLNIDSSSALVPKLTTYAEDFKVKKKKKILTASKYSEEEGLQVIKQKGYSEIYNPQ